MTTTEENLDREHRMISLVGRNAYRSGGFYDEPTRLDAFLELKSRAVRTALPHVDYSRPSGVLGPAGAPDYADKMRDWYRQLDKTFHTAAPVVSCELRDAVICNQIVYIDDGDGLLPIYESFRNSDSLHISLAETSRLERATNLPEGLCCYLGSVGYGNYGHWLVDDLSRAPIAGRAAREPLTWIVPLHAPDLDRAKALSLERLFGAPQNIVFVASDQPVRAHRLLYVSPTSYHPMVKSAAALQDLRRALIDPQSKAKRRLFIRRSAGAMCRRLLNIDAVEEALRPSGFECLDPGLLTFDEQVKAFSEAEIVVGVMGAAMANTLFCPDDVKLLYLTTEEFGDPFFWDLAAILGQDYRCLYGLRQESDLPIHFSDFRVDSSAVLEHVQELLAQRSRRAGRGWRQLFAKWGDVR